MFNNGYWYKNYNDITVIMRCGDDLVKTESGSIVFIAPICDSCNKRTDTFHFFDGTVIVPLYWNDQKKSNIPTLRALKVN